MPTAMYLLPIHVPIYVEGERRSLTAEWWRALELLRDSLEGRFGAIIVAAPSLPALAVAADQVLVQPPKDCGIELAPSFDLRCRAREFWLRERAQWRSELVRLARRADVVHAGLDDVYRPIAFEGFRAGVSLGKPTLFVQDTDIVVQQRQLAAPGSVSQRLRARIYGGLFERMCRWGVAHADLSLLKGSALMARYGRHAKNPKEFHDTAFSARDIVSEEQLERRVASLTMRRPLRLVYCGRLIERKGLKQSLAIVARAVGLAAQLQLDIIGAGPERPVLERLAASLGIADRVRFLGALPYDAALIQRLAGYDALLFTPMAEDTPRMIFDGYAAGLPLLAFDIAYVQERQREERAALPLPFGQIEPSAAIVADLCRNPQQLAGPARNARRAAHGYSAESWYARRAQWTREAVERRQLMTAAAAA